MFIYQNLQVGVFILGYTAIIFEHLLNIHKTASSLLIAGLCWMVFFLGSGLPVMDSIHLLDGHLSETSQIVFFLIGAMTIVEVIDAHSGFNLLTQKIQKCRPEMHLWFFGLASFFMSSILDNLTTTIAMISVLRKVVSDREERWIIGSLVVIAANAGGAWTPIGDVTTTMLWMNGQITTVAVMKHLFIPSFIALAVATLLFKVTYRKNKSEEIAAEEMPVNPYGTFIFILGISLLVLVPVLKAVAHIPPYMGMLFSLGILWVFTDLLHLPKKKRGHLKITAIMNKIDLSSALFFIGILLSIGSLEASGILEALTETLQHYITSEPLIAGTIGIASSVIDNVPIVAGCMNMYKMSIYPTDCAFWQMIAYCSGVGGSILIIGSAAGVAFMGMEKVDFLWYTKKVSLIALISYLSGLGTFLLLS
ncbi:putative Na+/H+ antiporter, NhaD family [Waddlia chondrophila 2032/99]|uniref:Putative Na+/H+ antiporter, NhaD family n=2 Tax=Waddlia chondrophila TaxID=71667 RepID=D6YTX7_WADCW|nr:sodium:proton antiporter NhaD [Waddlia chondrophila]ADI37588.1 putative Na+/H+ antiporter, NhaD family [Waddlia chondrophila WSU 86-1044]CCB91063.1 putative Na+/H+ antiporter, NhaD family [Waddlia chondrophila 2032/99]